MILLFRMLSSHYPHFFVGGGLWTPYLMLEGSWFLAITLQHSALLRMMVWPLAEGKGGLRWSTVLFRVLSPLLPHRCCLRNSSSSLSVVSVVSSAYLRLLILLPAILISTCASSSPAFLMMYSAYKLIKQGIIYSLDIVLSNLKQVHCSMTVAVCCFFTCI